MRWPVHGRAVRALGSLQSAAEGYADLGRGA
jgi:hypothetical protein